MATVPAALPTADRLTFRRMNESDIDAVHSLLGDAQVMRHYPRVKTRDECLVWINRMQLSYHTHGFGLWLLDDEHGRFIGECGLIEQDVDGGRVEIGYHLLPPAQGQGYATEAASASIEFGRKIGITEFISIIDPQNTPSRDVALRVGMRLWRRHDIFGGIKDIYRIRLS